MSMTTGVPTLSEETLEPRTAPLGDRFTVYGRYAGGEGLGLDQTKAIARRLGEQGLTAVRVRFVDETEVQDWLDVLASDEGVESAFPLGCVTVGNTMEIERVVVPDEEPKPPVNGLLIINGRGLNPWLQSEQAAEAQHA